MSDYYFTTNQLNEIEALYSYITLAKSAYQAQNAIDRLSLKVRYLIQEKENPETDDLMPPQKCHKDDPAFHEQRGS